MTFHVVNFIGRIEGGIRLIDHDYGSWRQREIPRHLDMHRYTQVV